MDCQSSIWFIHLFRDHDGWFAGRAAAAKVEELGLSRGNPRIQFAQLKGMADVLSLSLVHAGFRVSKVLAFGSVPEFIPFIVRRAEENRGLLGNTSIDRQCLRCDYILFPSFEKLVLFCFNSLNSPQFVSDSCFHSGHSHRCNEIFVSVVFPDIVMHRIQNGAHKTTTEKLHLVMHAYTRILMHKFEYSIRWWIAILIALLILVVSLSYEKYGFAYLAQKPNLKARSQKRDGK